MNYFFILNILIVVALFIFAFSPIFLRVPFMPTHKKQARKMMDLAEIKVGMKVVDLGSGAGRLLFLAAERGAFAVGYELNPFLVLWTKLMIILKGRQDLVKVHYKTIYDANIKDADVIMMFLFPSHMIKIIPKLDEAKSGAKILAYTFPAKNWTPIKHEEAIYVYKK